METIESTFVSSVGKFVDDFERKIEAYTGTAKAVATVNGTAALHAALYMADVQRDDLVITQALTFVATCNALYHMGAEPIFVDVSPVSLGLCPKAVDTFLEENAEVTDVGCIHKQTGRRIKAVVPMHTFGHPVELDELVAVCLKWNVTLVEDAAESLGSFYKGKHTGTVGEFSAVVLMEIRSLPLVAVAWCYVRLKNLVRVRSMSRRQQKFLIPMSFSMMNQVLTIVCLT